jgi:hypothetical protein
MRGIILDPDSEMGNLPSYLEASKVLTGFIDTF